MSAYAQIEGNLGKDPEFDTLPSGDDVAKFSVAVNHWKGKDKESTTTWFTCRVFGKRVEQVRKWAKGDLVFLRGDIELRNWKKQDGSLGVSLEMSVDRMTNPTYMQRCRGGSGDSAPPARRPAAPPAQRTPDEELPF